MPTSSRLPVPRASRFAPLVCLLAFVCTALTPAARASSITYYYTGQAFTTFTGGFTCGAASSCALNGWMTLANPFGDNAFSDPTSMIAYSFTDGVTTFDNTNSTLVNSLFATNGSGEITNWVISGDLNGSSTFTFYQSANWPGNAPGDLVQVLGGGDASNSTAGSWSFTPPVVTPEPASVALVGTGLLLLLGLGWRRQAA